MTVRRPFPSHSRDRSRPSHADLERGNPAVVDPDSLITLLSRAADICQESYGKRGTLGHCSEAIPHPVCVVCRVRDWQLS